ncbi:hypothetical protein [Vibrio cyclitrophicus]|uniref:hypothetical protein n=1 Tax=Vibrio cyclitrophicus TaxID=47951 RepID=UPI0007EE9C25|nr:hypothetical protein [Vibrio cyclitrophicus]OBT23461.1 hypothetical protein A9263_10345 [Vibrio cyclitrophicus]PMF42394.1 hypothetical protein BCV15_13430 [Vibrio cyclitrophicus]
MSKLPTNWVLEKYAKVCGLSEGDTNKCESIYIQLRAESIVDEAKVLNEACELVARNEAKRAAKEKQRAAKSEKRTVKSATEQQVQASKAEKEQVSDAWESQLLLSIHNEDYDKVHGVMRSGVAIPNEEFAEKCRFLLTKCKSQDLVNLVTFFLKQNNY